MAEVVLNLGRIVMVVMVAVIEYGSVGRGSV